MNKQEAIEQIKQETYHHCGEKECYKDGCKRYVESDIAIDIINQIDEPQKATVPKFVAEWIKDFKQTNYTIPELLSSCMTDEVDNWYYENSEQFMHAWLDGYDIEQEKLYTVEIPNNFKWKKDGSLQSLWRKSDARIL